MIETNRHGRVLEVTLNRPEKRNALSLELCNLLVEAFDTADADPAIGAILLTANGAAFSAGMDLKESLHVDRAQLSQTHERLFTTIRRIRKPLIAAVENPALAGGTGLVANAHIVVAGPNVRFGLTEMRIGLWPLLIFKAVAQAVGERRAVELSLTGREFSAQEALAYGLVTEISESPRQRAAEIAGSVSQFSSLAIAEGLEYVHQTRGRDWEDTAEIGQQARYRLMAGDDYKESVRRFLEKRKP